MKDRLGELETFIRDNLKVSEQDLTTTGSLVLVLKIEAIDVIKGYTPIDFDRKAGGNVDISFDVETRLQVVVDTIQLPDSRVFAVGGGAPPHSYLPHREVLSCPLTVVVTATAVFEGGEYKDIRFVRVMPKRTLEELLAVNRVQLESGS